METGDPFYWSLCALIRESRSHKSCSRFTQVQGTLMHDMCGSKNIEQGRYAKYLFPMFMGKLSKRQTLGRETLASYERFDCWGEEYHRPIIC